MAVPFSFRNKMIFAILTLPLILTFYISVQAQLGSILLVNGEQNESYISEIQHVRRRETIAMTPANCLDALKLTRVSLFEVK